MPIVPWDETSAEDVNAVYSTVSIYKRDLSSKNRREYENIMLQGSVDEIFTTTVNGMLPHRIIMTGAPGKGKTTAVAKMAYDWAHGTEGSPFQDVPLLFVVSLQNVDPNISFAQAIKSELLRDVRSLSTKSLADFISENQDLCWVILDGLEEFNKRKTTSDKDNVGNDITDVIHNKDLPQCRVLLTSRPGLEHNLPPVYARMTINGFSFDSAKAYIDIFFEGRTKGQKLKRQLEKMDLLLELISTPLFCVMACHQWDKGQNEHLETESGILEQVNLFLSKHRKLKLPHGDPIETDSTYVDLGKVALTGLLSNSSKFIFDQKDFSNFSNALEQGCDVGVISRKTVTLSQVEPGGATQRTAIQFHHKLAQLHLAGKYVAKKANRSRLGLKTSKLDTVLRQIKEKVKEYVDLLRFIAGTTDDVSVRVIEYLKKTKHISTAEKCRMVLDCSSEFQRHQEQATSVVQQLFQTYSVELSSPTIYTATGINRLPITMFAKVLQFVLLCFLGAEVKHNVNAQSDGKENNKINVDRKKKKRS